MPGRGLPLIEQRAAATLVALILSLCVLALLAMPLTWRRVTLLVAALAAFVLLFPVTAVRRLDDKLAAAMMWHHEHGALRVRQNR